MTNLSTVTITGLLIEVGSDGGCGIPIATIETIGQFAALCQPALGLGDKLVGPSTASYASTLKIPITVEMARGLGPLVYQYVTLTVSVDVQAPR